MNVVNDAKQGRTKSVIAAVEHGGAADLQLLLRKTCQDYRSIKKHAGHLELVRYLLSIGAKPEKEMVCEAVRGGHDVLVHALIEGGLPVDIFVAAALGQAHAVQAQIDHATSNVTATDSQGMTPLHYCCASSVWQNQTSRRDQFFDTSSRLLAAGASVHTTGVYHALADVTPLFYVAWTGGHSGIAHSLLQHAAQVTPHIFFAAVGHFQRHGAANYDVAKVLLEHGFDINHLHERTALHALASHEDAPGVSWLLKHGADVHAQDIEGNTPLMVAARRNTGTRVLRLLVAAGASLTQQNHHAQTPLAQAELHRKTNAITYLKSLTH